VVVQLRNGSGHDGAEVVVCAVIKRLVRRSSGSIELEQYNPAARFQLPLEKVAAIHRVVRLNEIMGF
jgi:phage repressor protein C with HTH and peptisase S24 domain